MIASEIQIDTAGSRWTYLPDLFKSLGYTCGAEIGVERGKYSERLCKRIPGLRLICVDPWKTYTGYREHVSQAQLDQFYEVTQARLAPYNAEIVRSCGYAAASHVRDRSLDFVYIDANHEAGYVLVDLEAWVPKVRPGGIVAGHDYNLAGVQGGLQSYFAGHPLRPMPTVHVLAGDKSPTWLWVQP